MTRPGSDHHKDRLFPAEVTAHSAQYHYWRHSVTSQLIYSLVLMAIVIAFGLLPFIYVDITVKSRGVIRPMNDRKVIVSPVSGTVARLRIQENRRVEKGELLIRFDAPSLENKLAHNAVRQKEVMSSIRGLEWLVALDSTRLLEEEAPFYLPALNSSLRSFRHELGNAAIRLQHDRRQLRRSRYLRSKRAISEEQLQESAFTWASSLKKYRMLLNGQLDEWEHRLKESRKELETLRAEADQLQLELKRYRVFTPLTGTIHNMAAVAEGGFVASNQKLAEISPDTLLVAECHVTPHDIGLLKKGMQAGIQVEAFDYRYWGSLQGEILEISDDVTVEDGRPYFRVKASLNTRYLQLENGYRGRLKKGMTVQARFRIARRSLYSLLYDNVNEWLNPNDSRES